MSEAVKNEEGKIRQSGLGSRLDFLARLFLLPSATRGENGTSYKALPSRSGELIRQLVDQSGF